MHETQRPSPGYFTTKDVPELKDRFSARVPQERLDELLLELILIDTVALADPRRGPIAERLIDRAMSPSDYASVMDRYDEISDDDDDEVDLVGYCFKRAAAKDSHWKSKMLRWLIHIVGRGQSLSSDELIEIAGLASAMNAKCELDALHRVRSR